MVYRVVDTGLPLVYLNMIGGQDDQVFDGASFVLNPGGALAAQLPQFDACITHIDFEETAEGWRALPGVKALLPKSYEADYREMCIRDRLYFEFSSSCFSSQQLLEYSVKEFSNDFVENFPSLSTCFAASVKKRTKSRDLPHVANTKKAE